MSISDKDLSDENGIRMLKDLYQFSDIRVSDQEALEVWQGLCVGEKMRTKTEHMRIIGNTEHA
jgi:hypothetical protein